MGQMKSFSSDVPSTNPLEGVSIELDGVTFECVGRLGILDLSELAFFSVTPSGVSDAAEAASIYRTLWLAFGEEYPRLKAHIDEHADAGRDGARHPPVPQRGRPGERGADHGPPYRSVLQLLWWAGGQGRAACAVRLARPRARSDGRGGDQLPAGPGRQPRTARTATPKPGRRTAAEATAGGGPPYGLTVRDYLDVAEGLWVAQLERDEQLHLLALIAARAGARRTWTTTSRRRCGSLNGSLRRPGRRARRGETG